MIFYGVIIYYLKNDVFVVDFIENILSGNSPIYISSVTELELFSFSDLSAQEKKQINDILQTLHVIPLDSQLARLAGFLRANYKIKTPDSIIAATAIFTGSELLTRNIKDFQSIDLLRLKSV